MKMSLEIDSPEEALATAKAIHFWADDAGDSRNLTAEIGGITAKLTMALEEYLTDCAITFEEERKEYLIEEQPMKAQCWCLDPSDCGECLGCEIHCSCPPDEQEKK